MPKVPARAPAASAVQSTAVQPSFQASLRPPSPEWRQRMVAAEDARLIARLRGRSYARRVAADRLALARLQRDGGAE